MLYLTIAELQEKMNEVLQQFYRLLVLHFMQRKQLDEKAANEGAQHFYNALLNNKLDNHGRYEAMLAWSQVSLAPEDDEFSQVKQGVKSLHEQVFRSMISAIQQRISQVVLELSVKKDVLKPIFTQETEQIARQIEAAERAKSSLLGRAKEITTVRIKENTTYEDFIAATRKLKPLARRKLSESFYCS
jgi:hypothetical protein